MLVNAGSTSEQQQVVSQGSNAAGSQSKPILAYKGQLMHWRLLVANTGQCLLHKQHVTPTTKVTPAVLRHDSMPLCHVLATCTGGRLRAANTLLRFGHQEIQLRPGHAHQPELT